MLDKSVFILDYVERGKNKHAFILFNRHIPGENVLCLLLSIASRRGKRGDVCRVFLFCFASLVSMGQEAFSTILIFGLFQEDMKGVTFLSSLHSAAIRGFPSGGIKIH